MLERVLALIALWLLLMPMAHAQSVTSAPPPLLSFQGRLAKSDGTPFADASVSVRFSLWDAPTGGTKKWEQTSSVMVRNGIFSTLFDLGVNATEILSGNVWLEMQMGEETRRRPRQQIVSVAYAIKAETVPDNAITAAKLANHSVTTPKLADRSVTLAKLAGDIVLPQSARYINLAWDDFHRPDGAIGATPNGYRWILNGVGGFAVRNNKLVNFPVGTVYGWMDLPQTVHRMEAEWTFEPGKSGAAVALITGKTGSPLLTHDVHIICSSESCSIQLYRLGQTPLIPTLAQMSFPVPLARDSKTVHRMTYEIDGDTVTVTLSNGMTFSATDPRIRECTGQRAIIEIHSLLPGVAEPRYVSFAAFHRDSTQPSAAYASAFDIARMIAASNALGSPSMRFTPSAPGWYRIAQGAAQMLGVCHVSSKGTFLGGSLVDAQFGYTCNAYAGQPGALSNIMSSSVNLPALAEARVSNGAGVCYLDIRVTAGGTPLEIALTGLNRGTLLSTPQFQPIVGSDPVSLVFP